MKTARLPAFLLATSLLALNTSAQQMESARLNASAPMVGAALASDSALSAPAGNALIRAVTPPKPGEHKFFDKQQIIGLYVHARVRTADTVVTCHNIANGATEMWIPTQSCTGIAVWQAASVGAALGIGWLFHKTGHHKLERMTPWVATSASAAGLTKSVFNIH